MSGKPVTIDTNGWFALLNNRDRLHRIAVTQFATLLHQRRSFLLTDWIMLEYGETA